MQGLAASYILGQDYTRGNEYNELAITNLLAAQNHRGVGMCRINRAHILRMKGQYHDAVEELTAFIASKRSEADPRNLANAYDERSQSLLELGKFDEAIQDAEKAVSLDATNPLLLCEMQRVCAQSFIYQKDFKRGVEEIKLAYSYLGQLSLVRRERLRSELGRMEREVYLSLGKFDEAVEHSIVYAKAILNIER